MITRRALLQALGAAWLLSPFWPRLLRADDAGEKNLILRKIPSSGERLPAVGMGTSRTFDVELDAETKEQLAEVLRIFFAWSGRLIDSSPMYGRAESVVGTLLPAVEGSDTVFTATKVWTDGKEAGVAQMEQSARRMGVERLDLIQIHNLRDWRVHVETLKAWKEEGRVRYIGITTSHGRDHAALEEALRAEAFDFVQLSYNLLDRSVEDRLLPLARERGTAVLVNRPFQRGELFAKVKGKALPDWAAEIGCVSPAQVFLKFVCSHPAVTCAIPATSKPRHMADNMQANFGPLPDAALRERMVTWMESL
jgi:aryl-alcohol dehydrogenase-like predicted oxidoreductase